MASDLVNFTLSLASALCTAANLTLGQDVFALQADETAAGNKTAYAVLRPYGGPKPELLLPAAQVAIQCAVVGNTAAAALNLAELCYGGLHQTDGNRHRRALHNVSIAGKTMAGNGTVVADGARTYGLLWLSMMQPPGTVAVDERGRTVAVFNFEARFNVR